MNVNDLNIQGMIISKDHHILVEENKDMIKDIYSGGKSIVSMAMGIAIEEGLLSLEEKLTDVFKDECPTTISKELSKATVRELLTMCLGQKERYMFVKDREAHPDEDWVKLSLHQPWAYMPGTHFQYSNVGPYLASALIQKRAGCHLEEYLKKRLFDPMGIDSVVFGNDPQGRAFGASSCQIRLKDLHKLGELYLNKGVYQDQQLIPRSWVEACFTPQGYEHYSYLFWIDDYKNIYIFGKFGQYCLISPIMNSVITIMADHKNYKEIYTYIEENIFPKLTDDHITIHENNWFKLK